MLRYIRYRIYLLPTSIALRPYAVHLVCPIINRTTNSKATLTRTSNLPKSLEMQTPTLSADPCDGVCRCLMGDR